MVVNKIGAQHLDYGKTVRIAVWKMRLSNLCAMAVRRENTAKSGQRHTAIWQIWDTAHSRFFKCLWGDIWTVGGRRQKLSVLYDSGGHRAEEDFLVTYSGDGYILCRIWQESFISWN